MDFPEYIAVAYDQVMCGTESPEIIHTSAKGLTFMANKMTDITDERRKELLDCASECPAGCWIEMTAETIRYVNEGDD